LQIIVNSASSLFINELNDEQQSSLCALRWRRLALENENSNFHPLSQEVKLLVSQFLLHSFARGNVYLREQTFLDEQLHSSCTLHGKRASRSVLTIHFAPQCSKLSIALHACDFIADRPDSKDIN
jgi:hypothetical protein